MVNTMKVRLILVKEMNDYTATCRWVDDWMDGKKCVSDACVGGWIKVSISAGWKDG